MKLLGLFPGKVAEAGAALSPTVLKYRLLLIDTMAKTLRSAMNLLGIELPERM